MNNWVDESGQITGYPTGNNAEAKITTTNRDITVDADIELRRLNFIGGGPGGTYTLTSSNNSVLTFSGGTTGAVSTQMLQINRGNISVVLN